jgi:hypothetical protein
MAFILLVHLHKKIQVDAGFVLETIENSNLGIDHYLINTNQLNDTIVLNLNDEDYKSLKVNRSYWGIFEKVTSESKIKSKTFKRIALIGGAQPKEKVALNVFNNDLALNLVGDTRIVGSAYLPRRGVKPGYINGNSYHGSNLIYGTTQNSFGLPEIPEELQQYLGELENSTGLFENSQVIELKSSISNSFTQPVKVIYSASEIILDSHNLIGNIIIVSSTKISVLWGSNLKDVILVAPSIEIGNSVKGNFQAVASKNIRLGKKCHLKYPTALILLPKDDNASDDLIVDDTQVINVEEGSKIEGVIAYFGEVNLNYNRPQIKIENDVYIKGEIYCNDNLELLGNVDGTVYTRNFILNAFGSIYQNHIYNTNIIATNLGDEYVGLLFNNSKKGILQWLY